MSGLRMGKYREAKEQEVLLPHFTAPAYKGRDHVPFHYPWACSSDLGYSNNKKITYLMRARSQNQDLPEWMEYVPSKIEQLGETDENLNKKRFSALHNISRIIIIKKISQSSNSVDALKEMVNVET